MDNDAPETMHYYDDELHQYLSGAAHTFSFKTDASHEDSIYLSAGYKLAFQSAGKDYYLDRPVGKQRIRKSDAVYGGTGALFPIRQCFVHI